jgi:hypothetical protein
LSASEIGFGKEFEKEFEKDPFGRFLPTPGAAIFFRRIEVKLESGRLKWRLRNAPSTVEATNSDLRFFLLLRKFSF